MFYLYSMKRNLEALFLLALCLVTSGCVKLMPDEYRQLDEETRTQRRYVNQFAWNTMDTFYLWRDKIASAMAKWQNWEEPIQKVAEIRYKDSAGKDIDRWTMLTDDMDAMQGSVSGHTRTLGMDFHVYYADRTQTRVCAVVTYTYAGSPAAEAGLQRGDVILKVDGRELTPDNYLQLIREGLLGGGTVRLGLSDERTVTLTAIDMYENPVQTACVLEAADGRKVGYLHYTSFTLDSCEDLVNVFDGFVAAGIDEMVLDLRYNGGGYVVTETVLASMLAPVSVVKAKSVLTQMVYNEKVAKEIKDGTTRFDTVFNFKSDGESHVVITEGANPDLPRLYVLTSNGSASASEALICGLKPYMDVILIGKKTSGKFCAGILLNAEDWYAEVKNALGKGEYEKALPYVENWGLYVMYSRYADCNGRTLSMPDGIDPDVEVDDNPGDGFPLGDPRETMLATALSLIEGRTRSADTAPAPSRTPVPEMFHPRTTGFFVNQF